MKEQLTSLLDNARAAGALVREKAAAAGQATMGSVISAIEKWLDEFPRTMSYGLELRTFGFVMGLSPSLEVELVGSHSSFPLERIDEILAENKSTSLTGMIFAAVRTTYRMHQKVSPQLDDPLIIKIKLALSPEISVFIGRLWKIDS